MGLLEHLIGPPRIERRAGSLENPAVSLQDPDAMAAAFGWGSESDSGETVNAGTAMTIPAFWQAVGMIAGDCSKMPLRTMRKRKNRRPVRDDSHYINKKIGLYGQANDDHSGHKLWRRVFTDALVWNNAYVWLDWQGTKIANLVQLLSDRTTVVRKFGRLWVVTEVGSIDDAGGPRMIARPYEEVLHIEGLCLDGLAGCETVNAARHDIGNALAARRFKSQFFKDGMHAGGILQAPIGAPAPAIEKMEDAIQTQHSSTNRAFRTVVMRDGFKYHSTQISGRDAQLTEQEESGVRDTARRFMLSPARLGVRDSISYNSLAQDRRDYHDTTLSWWTVCQLSELNTKALTRPERSRWEVQHQTNLALLFADAATLSNIATQGTQAGWLEKEEAREFFSLPPSADEDDDQKRPANGNAPEDATAPPPPADADDTPPPPPPANGQADQRSAHQVLLAGETGRLLRRLNTHAKRALEKCSHTPAALTQWLGNGVDHQLATAPEQLAPAWAVCRSAGLGPDSIEPADLAAEIAARYRQAAADRSGPLDDEATNTLAADLANHFLGE